VPAAKRGKLGPYRADPLFGSFESDMAPGIPSGMDRQEVSPAPCSVDVSTAIARIVEARELQSLSASEAMIAESTVVVCSVFGPSRFAPETMRLRRHLLDRCGVNLDDVAASNAEAAAAHARAFAPRPPKLRRRRGGRARLSLVD
jgi:hypothetical protein